MIVVNNFNIMIATAVIAFREFLEAFLIIGVFLGISNKLRLKKEKEIWLAAIIGILLSLLLSTIVYLFGERARSILSEENIELLESCLLIFSGLFIAYVVFSLHKILHQHNLRRLKATHQRLQENVFDISLFFTIIFLVLREGFEIALFTASVSLFSAFMQNFIGLVIGFAAATFCGILTLYIYVKFPINKLFKVTEYLIILLGSSLFQLGITKFSEEYFHINLSQIIPLQLQFLPNEDSIIGHLLQGFFGIDKDLSLTRLVIMVLYIGLIYVLFMRQDKSSKSAVEH